MYDKGDLKCGENFPDILYLHKVHKMFALKQMVSADLSHHDFITLVTIDRLSIEKKADKIKVSEIVKCLEVPNAGVSRTLGKLEEKGLVFRSIDSMDRRNIYVAITENGKKLLYECQKNVDDFFDRVKEKFGREKSEQLQTLMDEFAKIWKEEMRLLNEKNK